MRVSLCISNLVMRAVMAVMRDACRAGGGFCRLRIAAIARDEISSAHLMFPGAAPVIPCA